MSVQLQHQNDFATPDKGGPKPLPTASAMEGSAFQQGLSIAAEAVAPATQTYSVTPSTEASPGAGNTNGKAVSPHVPRGSVEDLDSPAGPVRAAATTSDISNNEKTQTTTTQNSNTTSLGLPPRASTPSGAGGRHVRFGANSTSSSSEEEGKATADGKIPGSTESPASKRGLVSRRGGRYVSPGRSALPSSASPSPPLTGAPATAGTPKEGSSVLEYSTFRTLSKKSPEGSSNIPPLCSTNSSAGVVSVPPESEKEKEAPDGKPEGDGARPAPVPCVSSASPADKSPPRCDMAEKSLVSSPIPSMDRMKKTPFKSPMGKFQTLPSLDDPKLQSPVGIFLSPHPGTPSYKSIEEAFKGEGKEEKESDNSLRHDKIRDYSKGFATTPTDFTIDYGKGHQEFDTSNVLNWLQSPTANGLFSPGNGMNSLLNTPRGLNYPRTPGTPTVSQSFFFSDVASLPRNGDFTPQKGDRKRSPKRGGLSNIICISPLASSKNRSGHPHASNTPINFHDVFASPNPLLEDSPMKGGKDDKESDPGGVDAVHLAERDLMQDEDLSVLLQLAGNTPRDIPDRVNSGKSSASGHVFRSGQNDGGNRENLPGLQLPIIGEGGGDAGATRLSRKSFSRDHGDGGGSEGFVSPSLAIRQTSSSTSSGQELPSGTKFTIKQELSGKAEDSKPMGLPPKSQPLKNTISPPPHHYSSHPMQYPPRPPHDVYGYPPPMPSTGMRPGGRMSVVVGGPPPNRSAKPSSTPPARHPAHGASPHRHIPGLDPYPPPMSYAAQGHYTHHQMPPPMGGTGGYPYPHYPPHHPHHHQPPSHMPLYGAQHQEGSKLPAKKTIKTASKPLKAAKRPSLSDIKTPAATKKQKKAPSTGKRPKSKSPQLTDRADRQKAAANVAAVNAASGGKNDAAAALAAAILRGVTMRPSGKWQAQLYFAGKSRYIGVFDTREKAALAYEIAREKLKSEKQNADGTLSAKQTENAVNAARKAAFEGVNEKTK